MDHPRRHRLAQRGVRVDRRVCSPSMGHEAPLSGLEYLKIALLVAVGVGLYLNVSVIHEIATHHHEQRIAGSTPQAITRKVRTSHPPAAHGTASKAPPVVAAPAVRVTPPPPAPPPPPPLPKQPVCEPAGEQVASHGTRHLSLVVIRFVDARVCAQQLICILCLRGEVETSGDPHCTRP